MRVIARAENLSVRYHGTDTWILEAINLSVHAGEIIAVIGPSGCGKSTLIRTLAGLIPHSIAADYRGSLTLAGKEIASCSVTDVATHVGYVGQNPDAAVVTTSVWDEVCFPLQNLALTPNEICTRAKRALQTVGLADRAELDPWLLSGGQRQRLALAAALATDPQLLILDEPTATIDTPGRHGFYAHIAELAAAGTAVVVIDHDLDALLAHIDTVLALDARGAVIACGPPAQVFTEHLPTLIDAGIWIPRAYRRERQDGDMSLEAWCAGEKICNWRKSGGTWQQTTPTATDTPALFELEDAFVPGRSPAVSLSAAPGELIALVGTNGSGKTSLLSALAGLAPLRAKRAQLAGTPLREMRKEVGYVFQNPEHQFVRTSLAAEVALATTSAADTSALLDQFGLREHAERHPLTLSGGQARRLSVATMLGEQRRLILLDEPTYGQDYANTRELLALIGRLRSAGACVVMATHDLALAATHATQILALPAQRHAAREVQGEKTRRAGWPRLLHPLTLLAAVIAPMVMLIANLHVAANITAMVASSLVIATMGLAWRRTLGAISAIWLLSIAGLWVLANAVNPDLDHALNTLGSGKVAASLFGALVGLALISGIATSPAAMLRTLTTTLHVPYRLAAAAVASLAFVARFREDFRTLRQARKLRGIGKHWGIGAPVVRAASAIVPLMVSAVAHSERVALSMDARAFGAYPRRTELVDEPWRQVDTLVVACVWAATAVCWWYLAAH